MKRSRALAIYSFSIIQAISFKNNAGLLPPAVNPRSTLAVPVTPVQGSQMTPFVQAVQVPGTQGVQTIATVTQATQGGEGTGPVSLQGTQAIPIAQVVQVPGAESVVPISIQGAQGVQTAPPETQPVLQPSVQGQGPMTPIVPTPQGPPQIPPPSPATALTVVPPAVPFPLDAPRVVPVGVPIQPTTLGPESPPTAPLGVSAATNVGSTIIAPDTSPFAIDERALATEIDRYKNLQKQYDAYVNYIQSFLYTLSSDTQNQFRIHQTQFEDARNKASVLSQQAPSELTDKYRAIIISLRDLNNIMYRITFNLFLMVYYTGKFH